MPANPFTNPPAGVNLTESRTAMNNAVGIVLFVSSLVFVALRLFTRLRLKREKIGLDDYLMFVGLALNAGNLACCIAGGYYGLGKHIWSLDAWQMRQITIITFAYVFIYAWSVCIIKFSILALYHRIFGLSYLAWFCVVLTIGYLITNHIVLPLYTSPIDFYWNQWYGAQGEVRINEAKFYLGVGIINLFGDVCILAVPISNVLKLQMGSPQKIAICFMFLLGSFVCFASLYRIITITRLVNTPDISWAKSDVFIWSSVEPSVGIISGCLPALRPLMMRVLAACGYKHVDESGKGKGKGTGESSMLETISKKSTRKPGGGRDGSGGMSDTQFLESIDEASGERGDEDEIGEGSGEAAVMRDVELGDVGTESPRMEELHSRHWRLDDHQGCTTIVQGQVPRSSTDVEREKSPSRNSNSIVLTKKFEWDEGPAQKTTGEE